MATLGIPKKNELILKTKDLGNLNPENKRVTSLILKTKELASTAYRRTYQGGPLFPQIVPYIQYSGLGKFKYISWVNVK